MLMLRTATFALICVALVSAGWREECNRHCTHDNNHLKAQRLTEGCETYRYVLPRPKMFGKCKRAFDKAIQTGCKRACDGEKDHFAHMANNEAHNTCKHEKNEVPRPGAFEACKSGFHAGTKCVEDYIADLKRMHVEGAQDASAEAEAAAAAAAAEAAEAAARRAKDEAEAATAKAKAAAAAAEKAKAVEAEEAAQAAAKAKAEEEAAKAAQAQKAADEKQEQELEAARAAARAAYTKAADKEEEADETEEVTTE